MGNQKSLKPRLRYTFLFAGIIATIIIIITFLILLCFRYFLDFSITDILDSSKSEKTFIFILISVISLILAYAISFVLGRFIMFPVNKTINAMEQLASGHYKERLEFSPRIAKYSIFKDLSESFNKLANELEHTEVLSNEFVNNFSHEFKTPIVSIAGFTKLLQRDDLSPENRKEYLTIIHEESMRLSDMATNTMNLVKVENQTILTDIKKINISEQIRNSVLLLENKWESKNINLQLKFNEYFVKGNEELLKQIWINLLDNAIKFTPQGMDITISILQDYDFTNIKFTNTGSTIPADKQTHIFDKYYQADESHSSQGNGIGLAIVKRVVELHNGKVTVFSDDNSTSFTVTLPR